MGNGNTQAVLDLWHVLGAVADMPLGKVRRTKLLGQPIALAISADGAAHVWRVSGDLADGCEFVPSMVAEPLPSQQTYGYVWTCLGTPKTDLFAIPEYAESDRRNMNAATFLVHVSAPRAVENFLDMGHFPFVHTDYLGVESHPEVKDYTVEVSEERGEILATRCRFFQPMAALSAKGGMEVEYVYRVPHPYCAILYKSSPPAPGRLDVICIFLQPIDEEHVAANMLMSVIDHDSTDTQIKAFQQMIFAQDKPILENQVPKRLPLDPRAEMPVRADKSSIAYRRWLSENGYTYGTIPAAA
ncbi:MAG: aromatic ring-hydroxylating dioxygenase subunit alpha [Alphaproteobacteria bacterium]|nr:aromatic ring-hydroxylating dioxygenase subunit alpha [Alphaproteobacteria bacterium]